MSSQGRPGSNWSALQGHIRGGARGRSTPRRGAAARSARHLTGGTRADHAGAPQSSPPAAKGTGGVRVVVQSSAAPAATPPSPAPPPTPPTSQPLPWFAEDLSPEDMAAVLAESGQGAAPASAAAKLTENAVQWEGYLDPATKRRIVLGVDAQMDPAKRELGHYMAVDCEMVGVGMHGASALARVSLVNWHGCVVLDAFVRPGEKVTDYRTWVSGIRPVDLRDAPSFSVVQQQVMDLVRGRVLVGHAIANDLRALRLTHPRPQIRDTAQFEPLRKIAGQKQPGLRTLSKLVLGIEIQQKGHAHDPVEDARATMALFRTQKDAWDAELGVGAAKARRRAAAEGRDVLEKDAGSESHGVFPKRIDREPPNGVRRRRASNSPPMHPLPARPRTPRSRPHAAPSWWVGE
ncbi:3'-5' exonuclease [Malassezia sp. CBS 17886]|nr:3'-5' exonuclease [Malassezia sp. CBS 17886]